VKEIDVNRPRRSQGAVIPGRALSPAYVVLTKRSPGALRVRNFSRNERIAATLAGAWRSGRKRRRTPMGYQSAECFETGAGYSLVRLRLHDQQIPHEAGLQDSHISYTKGCYTGQEIVERVRSRGHVNRVRVLVKFDMSEPPPAGTALTADGKRPATSRAPHFLPRCRPRSGWRTCAAKKANLQANCHSPAHVTVITSPFQIHNTV